MAVTLLRPLGFGEVLDGAFTLYRRHFATLFATSLLVSVPMALASGLWVRLALPGAPELSVGVTVVAAMSAALISTLGWVLLSAALTWQTARAVTGGEVTVLNGYEHAIRRLVPLAIAAVLVLAGSFVVMMCLIVFMAIFGAVAGIAAASAGVAAAALPAVMAAIFTVVGLGMMLLVMTSFFAVAPAVVVERTGPVAALGRSWTLSRGARLRIAGVVFVSWLIVTLPTIGITLAAGMGPALVDPAAAAELSAGQIVVQQLLGFLSGALTFPFLIGCLTLLYFDRRVRTEAYDLELAADGLEAGGR